MPTPTIAGDSQTTFKNALNATKYQQFNSRGFIPFQFSSKKHQTDVSSNGNSIMNISGIGAGGSGSGTTVSSDARAWYEMWINPQKVELAREFIFKKEHTAGAIVSFHYRPDMITMRVSGVCGWIAINPQREKENLPLGFTGADAATKMAKIFPTDQSTQTLARIANNNSPRVFLSRLRNMAEEAMYFVDTDGIEHFNPKYIKIYTKQYPDGVVCEGYYKDFHVPESGEDAQTIEYSFEFMIERLIPVEELKSMNGMFNSVKGFVNQNIKNVGKIF